VGTCNDGFRGAPGRSQSRPCRSRSFGSWRLTGWLRPLTPADVPAANRTRLPTFAACSPASLRVRTVVRRRRGGCGTKSSDRIIPGREGTVGASGPGSRGRRHGACGWRGTGGLRGGTSPRGPAITASRWPPPSGGRSPGLDTAGGVRGRRLRGGGWAVSKLYPHSEGRETSARARVDGKLKPRLQGRAAGPADGCPFPGHQGESTSSSWRSLRPPAPPWRSFRIEDFA